LPAAASELDELTHGHFARVLADPDPPPAGAVERVFFCTGKIYFELVEERRRRGDTRTALVRLEQLYPWRPDLIREAVASYPNLHDVAWVQDEPANMGALSFVAPRLDEIFERPVRRIARAESASPATGSHKAHVLEQELIMNQTFAGGAASKD
jgi:2-oxoglutarate dehydrogenase E1 component